MSSPTPICLAHSMNFDHMSELRWRYGYAMVLVVMAIVDGYIFYRLRKAKWL